MKWIYKIHTYWAGVFLLFVTLCGGCATHREFFDSGGVPLSYTVEGQGEPVILIHGVAVNADLNWRFPGIIRALAKDYRVVSFDNRGHGRSGKPHGKQSYGSEMVEDVVRLMDHLNIGKAHVVGYSMGGFITLKLLAAHPERLISAAPCGAGWEHRDKEGMQRLEGIAEALETRGDYGPLLEETGIEKKGLGRVKAFVMNRFLNCVNDEKVMADVMRSLPGLEVKASDLQRNRIPVLSIVGEVDPLKRGVHNMEGVLANHEVVIVPRGSHYSTLNKREMVSVLRDFLQRQESHPSETENPVDRHFPGKKERSP